MKFGFTPSRYTIDGEEIVFLGNATGNMDVKFNRVANIASRYGEISQRMLWIIGQNPPSALRHRLAVSVLLILTTGIRIGNEDSANGYMTIPHPNSKSRPMFVKTYGLSTMLREHITIENGIVKFEFVGKKHVVNYFTISPIISKMVIEIAKLGLVPLFGMKESDLTSFVKKEVSEYLSSKDFRTFRANVYAYQSLSKEDKPKNKKEYDKAVKDTAVFVSDRLNNTEAVVKKSYIDPRIFTYMLGNVKPDKKEK